MIFETERLKLRELNIGDFKDLAEILQDKNVVYAYEHDFSEGMCMNGWSVSLTDI